MSTGLRAVDFFSKNHKHGKYRVQNEDKIIDSGSQRIDPYGGEIPARVQKYWFMEAWQKQGRAHILDTPFQILLLYFPFSLLSDPTLARAIFTLIWLALFALAILSLRITDWETPRIFTILFIFFAVFNFYTFQAIYEANLF
jgi:hypothetical protein